MYGRVIKFNEPKHRNKPKHIYRFQYLRVLHIFASVFISKDLHLACSQKSHA